MMALKRRASMAWYTSTKNWRMMAPHTPAATMAECSRVGCLITSSGLHFPVVCVTLDCFCFVYLLL
jgi:hypothetical protein